MAERDSTLFPVIATTNTSAELGVMTYRELRIMLEQDANLARTVRGVGARTLGVHLVSGSIPVDPDNQTVSVEIFDAFDNLVLSGSETHTGSGSYAYTYTPPASASLGIYHAVHTFTVGGSAAAIDEWFRIVSTLPGDYHGVTIRGEQTWSGDARIVSTLGILTDPDASDVKFTVRSPRGVVLVNNAVATRTSEGMYRATYAPGHNDPTGDYAVTFTYAIDGTPGSAELWFTVVERKAELAVSAQDFRNSIDGKYASSTIEDWTDTNLEEVLADAQDRVEQIIGYPLAKHVVSGEWRHCVVNPKNEIYLKFKDKPVYKIIRTLLRYHPYMEAIELHIKGWEVHHDLGSAIYKLQAGWPFTDRSRTLLAERNFGDTVEMLVDYEAGYDEVPRTVKQAIRLIATALIDESNGVIDIKTVKAGDHSLTYRDQNNNTGYGASQLGRRGQRAFEILNQAGLIPPSLV